MKKHLRALPICLLLAWFSSCSDLDRTDPKDLTGVAWLENSQESSSATASSSSEADLSSADSYSSSQTLSSSIKPSSSSLSTGLSSSSLSSASSSSSLGISSSSSTSRTYKTVTIGTQTWMAENLDEGTFALAPLSNPGKTGEGQVNDSLTEKYCFYNNATECEKRGGLYAWTEAMGVSQGCYNTSNCATHSSHDICPEGWRLPSPADFETLIDSAGGMEKAGAMLKAHSGNQEWDDAATNFNDPLGFGAIGAGFYSSEKVPPLFEMDGGAAVFWTNDEIDDTQANTVIILYGQAGIETSLNTPHVKTIGASVRCIKD